MMENLIKMDDLGVPLFLETPIYFLIYLTLSQGCWIFTSAAHLDFSIVLPSKSRMIQHNLEAPLHWRCMILVMVQKSCQPVEVGSLSHDIPLFTGFYTSQVVVWDFFH